MPQDALQYLQGFVVEADTVNVLMVADSKSREDDEISFDVQRLDMSQGLADRFREIVLENAINGVEENLLIPYSTGRKLDRHELFYVDLDDESDTAETLDFIESVTEPEVFTKEEDFTRRMAFYSIVFEDMDGTRAAFHRKHAPKNQLARGILTRMIEKNQFDKLDSQVYLFDEKVDFFHVGRLPVYPGSLQLPLDL